MTLKTREEKVTFVDYGDLERFIDHHYPKQAPFEIPDCEETGNGSSLRFNIDGKVSKYNEDKIANGDRTFMTRILLNDMAKKGLINCGKYIVTVSW